MKFTVLTLFPEIPRAFFTSSIMAKAVEKGIIAYDLVNIRDFAFDRHHTCDDAPYGGGAGQLLLPEPLGLALDSVEAYKKTKHVIYVTPSLLPASRADIFFSSHDLFIEIYSAGLAFGLRPNLTPRCLAAAMPSACLCFMNSLSV